MEQWLEYRAVKEPGVTLIVSPPKLRTLFTSVRLKRKQIQLVRIH
jgi:hypothetical protein